MSQRMGVLMLCLVLGCASEPESRPVPGASLDVVEAGRLLPGLAQVFYERAANRRFDSIATYNDPALREFFRTPGAYSDYYAGLVAEFTEAHFEANRPIGIELREFAPEGPTTVSVTVLLRGENGLPLRWWKTHIVRVDRWERIDGRWWIIPGKL